MGEGGAIPEVVALRHWCQRSPSASLTLPSPQNQISGVVGLLLRHITSRRAR
jgi:hypothetical protein